MSGEVLFHNKTKAEADLSLRLLLKCLIARLETYSDRSQGLGQFRIHGMTVK